MLHNLPEISQLLNSTIELETRPPGFRVHVINHKAIITSQVIFHLSSFLQQSSFFFSTNNNETQGFTGYLPKDTLLLSSRIVSGGPEANILCCIILASIGNIWKLFYIFIPCQFKKLQSFLKFQRTETLQNPQSIKITKKGKQLHSNGSKAISFN